MHTDPTGTCSSQSGCGTLAPINPFPRSCRVPQGRQPQTGCTEGFGVHPEFGPRSEMVWLLRTRAPCSAASAHLQCFPKGISRHFGDISQCWGHKQRHTQVRAKSGHTFPGGGEKEHKLLGIKYFFSSQPTASPAQSSWAPAGSQGSSFVLQLSFNGYLGIFSTKAAPSSPGAQC